GIRDFHVTGVQTCALPIWTPEESAAHLTDLRGTGGSPVQVVEAGTGRVLGTVDAANADQTVHPGAVYVHQGVRFVVDALVADDGDRKSVVEGRRLDLCCRH